MKRILMVACLLSGSAQASEVETVSWFAAHPAAMGGVLKLCRERPDLARHNGNCINADAAQATVTQRELSKGGASRTNINPFSAKAWATRPAAELRQQAWICDMMDKSGEPIDANNLRICAAIRGAGG